jgi:N12 class adenine-specific DNA methylase
VIGNVPFAKTTPFDPRHNRGKHSLHNYFLAKSLALTRPAGVMLALTSRYTMDARNPAARRELAQYADLVGALRLPGGAMRAVAGTEAVMDLLVLRRREPGSDPHPDLPAWDRVVDVEVDDESNGEPATVQMNRYFAECPGRVLGVTVAGRGMYRDGELMVRGDLDTVGEQVSAGLASMIDASPLRYTPAPSPTPGVARPAARRRIGDVEVAGERRVALREDSFVVSRSGVIYRHAAGELAPAEVPKSARHEVVDLVRLRDATVNLLHLESNDAPEVDIDAARAELRTCYERYRHRWGPLNRVKWGRTGKVDPATGEEKRRRIAPRLGGFREDPDWPTVSAVEVYDPDLDIATPAAIQRERTIHPPRRHLGADTAEEALAISLDETATVDVVRIAELLGVDEATARDELGDRVFTDPGTGSVVAAEEYLSGNVRTKLAAARAAAERDRSIARNVAALEAVHPVDLTADEISARPGATWIEPSEVEAFMAEVLGIDGVAVEFIGELGRWHVDVPEGKRRGGLLSDWGTGRVSPERLFDACLNQRMIKVYDRLDDDTRVVNDAETAAARDMQERISERFGAWLWEEPERARRAAARYNELFNSYVAPSYNGDHLTFPGLAATFVPHPHQRAAVARILRDGRCLLAHAVGAGKTATMVMAGMELRRLGLVNRPAYVVPNHMLEQFSREFLQLYPQARVLITSKDLTGPQGRKRFIARCATGDWDAVVITHSAFERLPLREDTYRAYTAEQLARLNGALNQVRLVDGDKKSMTVKRIEEAIERAENRLERLLATASKDDGVCFEESGIDHLFVDELHLFKNKAVVSSIEGMRNTAGSRRATDLDAKLWTLRREHGHRILVGATATPIANSIVECWIMQSYLQPDVLAETGLDNFDSWAATFGQTVSAVELAPDGGSYRVTSRLAKYRNVPELIAGFRRTADVLVRSDLALKLPSLEDDKPTVAVVQSSAELADYVEGLVARSEAIKNRQVEPDEDNMLKVTSDGRHAALDLRLVDRKPDPQGGKIEVAASRIAAVHRSTRHLTFLDDSGDPAPHPGGFQLVFCDLSTPRVDGEWSAYAELRRRLVAHGVPAGEIGFIHDAKTDEARARLFARCRSGQFAVFIGSTQKMGVGTNIHTRAVALHHLDCPWRPADIEQREGRIIRQGNQNDQVLVVRYATEGSFDVYMWQTCERKSGFIEQVMRGQVDAREMDDIGDAALSYAEVKALATGDPRVVEQFGLQADLAKLERRARAHRDDQHRIQRLAESARRDAAEHRSAAEAVTAALTRRTDTRGDRFRMEIDGEVHTSRAEAGAVLFRTADELIGELRHRQGRQETRLHTIGRLAGFPVTIQGVTSPHDGFLVEAHVTVDIGVDDANIVVRLNAEDLTNRVAENVVMGLETSIRNLDSLTQRHLERATTDDLAAAEAEACLQPFSDQAQFDDLRRRYDYLLAELNDATESVDDGAEATSERERAAAGVRLRVPVGLNGHGGLRAARVVDAAGAVDRTGEAGRAFAPTIGM